MLFTRLGDLLDEEDEEVEWLVDDHLPSGGLSMVAAKPKAGKSRCLALAVARGSDFLNCETSRGSVFYLALEEKRSEVRRHFQAMGATHDDEIFIFCASSPSDGLAQLHEATKKDKPALVIIDPLFRMVRVKDGNDYAQMTAALEPLMALARDTGAHVLAVHHSGKAKRSGGDSVLGSTAIFAAVDTLLEMKRSNKYRTLSSIQRYGTDLEEITFEFDVSDRGQFQILNVREDDLSGVGGYRQTPAPSPPIDADSAVRSEVAMHACSSLRMVVLSNLNVTGQISAGSRASSPTDVLAKTQPIAITVLYIKISTAIVLVANVTRDFDTLGLELSRECVSVVDPDIRVPSLSFRIGETVRAHRAVGLVELTQHDDNTVAAHHAE